MILEKGDHSGKDVPTIELDPQDLDKELDGGVSTSPIAFAEQNESSLGIDHVVHPLTDPNVREYNQEKQNKDLTWDFQQTPRVHSSLNTADKFGSDHSTSQVATDHSNLHCESTPLIPINAATTT
ncbi:unnamed protein product [Ilex paraguariensis]|uniref:Uncharacterized protein n=1 Tax=Ilex paraguariensis TaxID=185542 RepID=A0ABC8SN03_9AQUA